MIVYLALWRQAYIQRNIKYNQDIHDASGEFG